MSPFSGSADAIVATICHNTFPICSIDSRNNSCVVESLALGSRTSSICNLNNRSKIALKILLLCGTAASGEIFRFGCRSCFISSQKMISASPCATFSSASCLKHCAASGDFANQCGLLLIAALMCSLVQSSPQSIGHPSVAYWNTVAWAGCWLMLGSGLICPWNTGEYLLWIGVNPSGSFPLISILLSLAFYLALWLCRFIGSERSRWLW